MKLTRCFAHESDSRQGEWLHVLRVYEQSGRALEDCTTRFPIIVGRGSDADVKIDDQTVSRTHCGLSHGGGQMVLTDLESQNGTFVNGQPIVQHVLREGDEIRVGATAMIVINIQSEGVLAIDVKGS